MRHFLIIGSILLGCGLAGCGESTAPVPSGPLLFGRWGTAEGAGALLMADSSSALLVIGGCSTIHSTTRIALASDGAFAFRGRYQPAGGLLAKPPLAELRGQIQDDVVSLTVDVLDDGHPPYPLVLQHGVEPPSDIVCAL